MPRGRKKIKLTHTKSESYLINLKYYGPEPEVEGVVLVDNLRANYLNWYHAMTDTETARGYIVEYLEKFNSKIVNQFKNVPDVYLNYTAAYLMRMAFLGGILPEKSKNRINEALADMLNKAVVEKVVVLDTGYKPSVQDFMREQFHEAMGELNGLIDDGVTSKKGWSLFDHATKNEWPSHVAKRVQDKLIPIRDELIEVGHDPELKEAYAGINVKQQITMYSGLIDDLDRYMGRVKKDRKPRKRKAKSPDKIVAKMNYAKANDEYKLTSVAPRKIVGCQELWTFNPKTNALVVFRARTREGLTVKGSTIIDFDPDTSIGKKMGRKTKERLQTVLTSNKVALRKVMDSFIGTKLESIGRMNKDTIILRVF